MLCAPRPGAHWTILWVRQNDGNRGGGQGQEIGGSLRALLRAMLAVLVLDACQLTALACLALAPALPHPCPSGHTKALADGCVPCEQSSKYKVPSSLSIYLPQPSFHARPTTPPLHCSTPSCWQTAVIVCEWCFKPHSFTNLLKPLLPPTSLSIRAHHLALADGRFVCKWSSK